jgi:hypothetical protein
MNVYHIDLDYVLIEKIAVRIVLLAMVVQCDTVSAVLESR